MLWIFKLVVKEHDVPMISLNQSTPLFQSYFQDILDHAIQNERVEPLRD